MTTMNTEEQARFLSTLRNDPAFRDQVRNLVLARNCWSSPNDSLSSLHP